MSRRRVVPYGAWPAPVPVAALAEGTLGFEELLADDGELYWVEQRPADRGRSTLVSADGPRDVTRAPSSVGSRVHEYGGAAVLVADGTAWFVDKADQRIYRQERDGRAEPLTPDDRRRYGDLALDRRRGRLLAVCEDHRQSDRMPANSVVVVPLEGGEPQVVLSGRDFYLAPRVNPDGTLLAWVTWDFPRMPWDGTELYVAALDDRGLPGRPRLITGGTDESVCHPRWAPDGVLYFVSDWTGWWNLYVWDGGPLRAVAAMVADVGQASAMGRAPYDVGRRHVVAAARARGTSRLVRIDRADGTVAELPTGLSEVDQPRIAGDGVAFLGGSETQPLGVWQLGPDDDRPRLLRSAATTLDPRFLATPERLEIPTRDRASTHAFYYPPRSPHAVGPAGERPPLVVMAHGGPVSRTTTAPAFGWQAIMAPVYWTSRGYAVVDVDYRGSTGYGRAYRNAMYGRWGEVDVDDCIDAARFLVERGNVDGTRVVIRGPSAGGYTTLAALAFRDFFAAGTAYFPVADLESFHGTTHKYEAHYDEQLVGSWAHHRARYRARSPVNRADQVRVPLLILQGLDDQVCPPEQAREMVARLRALGRDAELVVFEDEGHGFNQTESIVRSLEAEAAFYARVLRLGDAFDSVRNAQAPGDELGRIDHES